MWVPEGPWCWSSRVSSLKTLYTRTTPRGRPRRSQAHRDDSNSFQRLLGGRAVVGVGREGEGRGLLVSRDRDVPSVCDGREGRVPGGSSVTSFRDRWAG